AAMSAMPTNAHALSHGPSTHMISDRVNRSGDFVTRHPWVLDARKRSFFGKGVAVTDATGRNFYSHRCGARLWISRSTSSNGPFGRGICTARIFGMVPPVFYRDFHDSRFILARNRDACAIYQPRG